MPDKKSYIVKESFRFGGQAYHTGGTVELTTEEAATLAPFLEGEAPAAAQSERDAQLGVIAALEKNLQELQVELEQYKSQLAIEAEAKAAARAELEQAKKNFTVLQDANDKNAADLKAARERTTALDKELAALKKSKGGK